MPPRITLKVGVILPPCPKCGRQTERLVSSWIYNSLIYRHYTCPLRHKEVIREAFAPPLRVERLRIRRRESKL